jgi:hypothetical protein
MEALLVKAYFSSRFVIEATGISRSLGMLLGDLLLGLVWLSFFLEPCLRWKDVHDSSRTGEPLVLCTLNCMVSSEGVVVVGFRRRVRFSSLRIQNEGAFYGTTAEAKWW